MMSTRVKSACACLLLLFVYGCFALNQIATTVRISGDETYFLFSGIRIFEPDADRLLQEAIQSTGSQIEALKGAGGRIPEGLRDSEYYLNLEFQQSSDEYRIPAFVTGIVYVVLKYFNFSGAELIGASLILSPIVFLFISVIFIISSLFFIPNSARIHVAIAVSIAFMMSWIYEVYFYRIFYNQFLVDSPQYMRMLLWGALKFTDDYFVFAHYPRSGAYALILASSLFFASGYCRASFFLCLLVLALHAAHGVLFFAFLTSWYVLSRLSGGVVRIKSEIYVFFLIFGLAVASFLASVSFFLATGFGINYPPFISIIVIAVFVCVFLYLTRMDQPERGDVLLEEVPVAFLKRLLCGLALIVVAVALACVMAEARASHSTLVLVLRLGSIFTVVLTALLALSLVLAARRFAGRWGVPALGLLAIASALVAQHNLSERLFKNETNQVTAARIYLSQVGAPFDFNINNQRHRIYFAIFSSLFSGEKLNMKY